MTTSNDKTPNKQPPRRSRRNSGALMEQQPPDWHNNNIVLRTWHDWVYPPNSKWYWYRRGKIAHSMLNRKYISLLVHVLVMAVAVSGLLMPLIMHTYAAGLRFVHDKLILHIERNETFWGGIDPHVLATSMERPSWFPLAHTWWFILAQCVASGLVTMLTYYVGAMHLISTYYVNQHAHPEEWKCQPDAFLSPDRAREERMLGCFNAFFAGCFGTGLYVLHLNYPFFQLYYESGTRGMLHCFMTAFLCYVWIDFYSYWAHRFLHIPFMYRHIHKLHHRYTSPTPFAAFALHPLEFIIFQSAGLIQLAFVPMHVLGYLAIVIWIAFHNQIDHSGIDFEGDCPWMPTTKYHDDHHRYFHLNFGLHFVGWDWLGGTLRSKDRAYGEDLFVGHQDGKTE